MTARRRTRRPDYTPLIAAALAVVTALLTVHYLGILATIAATTAASYTAGRCHTTPARRPPATRTPARRPPAPPRISLTADCAGGDHRWCRTPATCTCTCGHPGITAGPARQAPPLPADLSDRSPF
jgi:hypothetical protein